MRQKFQPMRSPLMRAQSKRPSGPNAGMAKSSRATPEPAIDAARRYSPGYVVAVDRRAVIGAPRHISTSLAERQNLSLRMASRRFTRLTNGFSKRADYHLAAVGLFVAHFNFCRVHEAHRVTPAMAQRITDHVWTIGELLTACLDNAPAKPRKVHRRFTVIQGWQDELDNQLKSAAYFQFMALNHYFALAHRLI